MDQYVIFKGKHAAQIYGMAAPAPAIRRGVKNISWTVCFDKNCAYTMPGADQKDWNKGGGLSFAPALLSKDMFSNHVDAAMWGWRYNPLTGLIELTAYCHIDGKRPFLKGTMYGEHHAGVDGEVCLELKFGQTARISFQVDRAESRYDFNFMVVGSGESWPVGVAFTHNKLWSRLIHPWFGGNNAAPHRMDLYMKRT